MGYHLCITALVQGFTSGVFIEYSYHVGYRQKIVLDTEPIVERGLCICTCFLSLGSVPLSKAAQDSSLGPPGLIL